MSNSFRDSHISQQDEAVSNLVWTVHLAKHEPAKFLVTMLACLGAAFTGYFFFRNPFPVMITLAAMLAALADFLLPVTYRVGPLGASSTSLVFRKTIRWEEVKACYLDACGVKLSPMGYPTRREAFHGVYLRFDGNRDMVIQAVKFLRSSTDD
jgi:hypothetical protein